MKKIKMEEMATRIAHQILAKVRVVKDSLPVLGHKKKKKKKKTKAKSKPKTKVKAKKKVSKKKRTSRRGK